MNPGNDTERLIIRNKKVLVKAFKAQREPQASAVPAALAKLVMAPAPSALSPADGVVTSQRPPAHPTYDISAVSN
jgi:hypothetical protein